jgi:hypothetical protein
VVQFALLNDVSGCCTVLHSTAPIGLLETRSCSVSVHVPLQYILYILLSSAWNYGGVVYVGS